MSYDANVVCDQLRLDHTTPAYCLKKIFLHFYLKRSDFSHHDQTAKYFIVI